MTTIQYRKEDEEDDDLIVRDGESVRVPMSMMDELQRSVYLSTRMRDDSDHPSRYKPVSTSNATAADDPREAALIARDEWLQNAWRGSNASLKIPPLPTRMQTGDAREDTYASYVHHLTNAWKRR